MKGSPMSFLQTLAAAFKGEGPRVPLARTFTSPWIFADGGGGRAPFEYAGAVRRAYLDNPVAQRAVRLVAEGIGGAPLLPTDPELAALVSATSAGQSLLETLAAQLLLHGNAYVQVMKDARGRPVELFALRPDRIAGQAQKEASVNEAHALTDALLHCAIEGELSVPPVTPVDGSNWLVGATASGDWAGQDGSIACRQGGNWLFVVPRDGMRVVDRSNGQERRFLESWRLPDAPVELSGGSVVDAQARGAILELVAALREAGVFAAP